MCNISLIHSPALPRGLRIGSFHCFFNDEMLKGYKVHMVIIHVVATACKLQVNIPLLFISFLALTYYQSFQQNLAGVYMRIRWEIVRL